MTAAAAFLMRNWRLIGLELLVLAIGVQTARLNSSKRAHEATKVELSNERERFTLFAERVRAKAEEISRRMIEHARRVEADQSRITQEVQSDYQERLARLRADYDRRMRSAAGGADSGRPGQPDVPGLPDSSGGADATPAPGGAELEFNCRANTLQLGALQQWLRRQIAVDRRLTEQ